MAGPLSLRAEICWGGDDARSEEHLPKAIHSDACSEWIGFHGDPFGQTKPIRAGSIRHGRQGGDGACDDFYCGLGVVTTIEDEGFTRLRRYIHDHGRERSRQYGDTLLQVREIDASALKFFSMSSAVFPKGGLLRGGALFRWSLEDVDDGSG